MCQKVSVMGVELFDNSAKKCDSQRVTFVFLCQVASPEKNLPKTLNLQRDVA